MNRLTARDRNGNAYYPLCEDGNCTNHKCCGINCELIDTDVCESLADYEETGLTPENIRQMDKLYREKCDELDKLQKEIFGYTE